MAKKFKAPFGQGSTPKTRTIQRRQDALGKQLRQMQEFRKFQRKGGVRMKKIGVRS